MKVKIMYHSIDGGGSIFATPDFTHSEIVEVDSMDDVKLQNHIESKKDDWGNHFKKREGELFMGYHYASHQGGVKIEEYKEPNVVTL
jgi:hypothetical protein